MTKLTTIPEVRAEVERRISELLIGLARRRAKGDGRAAFADTTGPLNELRDLLARLPEQPK